MRIYTKQGDAGETGLYTPTGARRVAKDDPRVEAYGSVDELNSWIGVIAARLTDHRATLTAVQQVLFHVGYDLSTPVEPPPAKVTAADTAALEAEIDRLTAELPPLKAFILPGGGETAAFVHVARTVCRRAERAVVRLGRQVALNPEDLRYLNRLSDYLFTLARAVLVAEGGGEVTVAWRT